MQRIPKSILFSRAFLVIWLVTTGINALLAAYVVYAFAAYRGPSSLRDWIDFAGDFVLWVLFSQLWAFPIAAVLTSVRRGLIARWGVKPAGTERCANCDYDLTGNVSGRCPECGEQINPFTEVIDRDRVWLPRIIFAFIVIIPIVALLVLSCL